MSYQLSDAPWLSLAVLATMCVAVGPAFVGAAELSEKQLAIVAAAEEACSQPLVGQVRIEYSPPAAELKEPPPYDAVAISRSGLHLSRDLVHSGAPAAPEYPVSIELAFDYRGGPPGLLCSRFKRGSLAASYVRGKNFSAAQTWIGGRPDINRVAIRGPRADPPERAFLGDIRLIALTGPQLLHGGQWAKLTPQACWEILREGLVDVRQEEDGAQLLAVRRTPDARHTTYLRVDPRIGSRVTELWVEDDKRAAKMLRVRTEWGELSGALVPIRQSVSGGRTLEVALEWESVGGPLPAEAISLEALRLDEGTILRDERAPAEIQGGGN